MIKSKFKKTSVANLTLGYVFFASFIVLVLVGRKTPDPVVVVDVTPSVDEALIAPIPTPPVFTKTEITEVEGHPLEITTTYANPLVIEDVYDDVHVRGRIVIDQRERVGLIHRDISDEIFTTNNTTPTYVHETANSVHGVHDIRHRASIHSPHDFNRRTYQNSDIGILDRRLKERDGDSLTLAGDNDDLLYLDEANIGLDSGGNNDIDATRFELDEDGGSADNLGDVGDFADEGEGAGKGSLPGIGEGSQVYAYNFPSQGVGAGVGNAGVGAAAGYAGIGAGIGQAVLNGAVVATLGGIGTAPISNLNLEPTPENDQDNDGLPASVESDLGTDPMKADTDGDGIEDGVEVAAYSSPLDASSTPTSPGNTPLPQLGGVGGLSNGAGAGAAAGLVTGNVQPKLGLGVGLGSRSGGRAGYGVGGRSIEVGHLPLDGSLHIMMHVDGSGSILNTRKELEVMKETLLKKALLPYYNNDESLYNKRVTIVDGNGERTLQFFKMAAKKDNVLALVFQDEAAPDYHLPTFNKIPQNKYEQDLRQLKSGLSNHRGLYRGVMFQVDRGKTFAKSFKEFVESSWNGTGYLKKENLKKYHRDENRGHIKNKDGIVFSDEYHAQSEGDAQYYLDLIFKASKRIGLDLDIYGGGLVDGKHNKN
tara:strand:- start:12323 stop:14269 length:1947 start_codon:yes stop_codon:yes gene_type:complete